jgi:hypothetical protein
MCRSGEQYVFFTLAGRCTLPIVPVWGMPGVPDPLGSGEAVEVTPAPLRAMGLAPLEAGDLAILPRCAGEKARDTPGVADPRHRVGPRLLERPPRTAKNAAFVCRSSTFVAGSTKAVEATPTRLRAMGTRRIKADDRGFIPRLSIVHSHRPP